MPPLTFDSAATIHALIATLSGLAVGTERQWSGHASGPNARLGGLRTFTMLGALAGISGWLWTADGRAIAVVLLAAAATLIAIGYARASRQDIDGTTEVAGIIVLAAGFLAGIGLTTLAMGITALTVLLLIEKTRLHSWVTHIDDEGIAAGARFAVMALVVLPLLPSGPFGPFGAIRPRQLWAIVLFFSGLSFCSYVIRRTVGSDQGFAISGILGGFISSTSVTLTMSRLSQSEVGVDGALASGVMGANAMLFLRVLIVTAVLAPGLPWHLAGPFAAPFLIATMLTIWGMRTKRTGPPQTPHGENPLQFSAALQMALLFQIALIAIGAVQRSLGATGLYGSAALLGFTEVDSMVVAMTRALTSGSATDVVTRAILIGILANTVTKFVIALAVGRRRYRLYAATGLGLLAVALTAAIWITLHSRT